MAKKRAWPARTKPRAEEFVAGPFRGMRDAPEQTTADPTLALYVGNMCRTPGPAGGGLFSRPGFGPMGDDALGGGGTPTTQALRTWTDYNGVRITVAIVGGLLYTYDWALEEWTESVTTTDLATESITLSATERVALVPFADGLVVSDGVNTPWYWDGTAGDTGIVKLTNAPVFYGPPTNYYGCLVGIKLAAGRRTTIVWSEPGDPSTGYEAGGYNNAWDNPGGYSDPLISVCGTNEALYVLRARVSIAITGAVTSDWATAGTRANLSEDVGTLSPWATFVTAQGVLIVDADAQPWLMRIGMPEPLPLWTDCRQTVRGTPRASLAAIETVQDDATYSLLIGYPEVGQTAATAWLCFSQEDLQFIGVWSWGAPADRAGPVVDGDGVARWAHAGLGDGRLYVHGDLESGPWDDALTAGIAYVAHSVVGGTLGYDLDREVVFHEIEAAITGEGVSSVAVSYDTSRGSSLPLTVSLDAGAGLLWDVDDWDEADWAGTTRDQRFRVGIMGRGRWMRPAVRHSEPNEPFGVTVLRVRGASSPGSPRQP